MLNLSTLGDERTKAVKEVSEIIGEVVKVSNAVTDVLEKLARLYDIGYVKQMENEATKRLQFMSVNAYKKRAVLYIAHIYETV